MDVEPGASKKERERARLELNRRLKREAQEKMEQRLRDSLGKPINTVSILWMDELMNLQECPALDQRWAVGMAFVAYLPGDNHPVGKSLEALELVANSLRDLLLAPFHVFWSHVLFNEGLGEFIDTYLRYCSRSFDEGYEPYAGKDARSFIFERVYKVLVRASSPKDSKDWFMDAEYHQAWMRSKTSWFDVPRIMDICVLYHRANVKQTQVLVSEIFRSNNKLFDDLKKVAQAMVTTLGKAFSKATVDARMMRDRELYLDDCLCTLYALFLVFPKAMRQFQLHTRLLDMLALDCHGRWLPVMMSASTAPHRQSRMSRLCVTLGWRMLEFCFLSRVFEHGTNKYQSTVADELWKTLETWMGSDYLAQLQDVHELSSALRKLMDKGTGVPRERVTSLCTQLDTSQDKVRIAIEKVVGAVPGIGVGFARAALYSMGLNENAVITALRKDQLPDALRGLDRLSGRPLAEVAVAAASSFDDKGKDELCVAELEEERGPVQFGSIHVGKKALLVEEDVDHQMRTFISRYADTYEDEIDDSFAIHAKLAVEPLAEDEEEGTAATQQEDDLLAPIVQPDVASSGQGQAQPRVGAGRGRGNPATRKKNSKKDTAYRKNASLKKHGMLNPK